MGGGDADSTLFGLAGHDAVGGQLDAVIGGVAQNMGQRVADDLDQLTVEFGVAAVDDESELLPCLVSQFADQAGQAGEQTTQRLHAGAHHRILEIRCQ